MEYSKEYTKEIVFPVGGIATGCIGLAGNGILRDFEIFNRPNKCSYNGYTGFVVKAEQENTVIDVRGLNGDYQGSYMGDWGDIGSGINRSTMAGLPCFKEHSFHSVFPFAEVRLRDKGFPADVTLKAFNPFIPMNEDDSGLPVGIYEVSFENKTDKEIVYSACLNFSNPCKNNARNSYFEDNNIKGFLFENNNYSEDDKNYGVISVATDAETVSHQSGWIKDGWYEGFETFWNDFSRLGGLTERKYDGWITGENITSSLSAKIKLKAKQRGKIRFLISWYYPNFCHYWTPFDKCENKPVWKNYYAVKFKNVKEVTNYVFANYDRLYVQSEKFARAFQSSDMPEIVKEAVSANLAVLKSPTCIRLPDGTFYGFEGSGNNEGSCEGSCSHVWNYQYALPFLFPKLERSMRDADFKYNQKENGGMAFRIQLPLGERIWDFRPCADGHLGGIIKTYREWKICGDNEWLKGHWHSLIRNIEYVWSEKNPDFWDPEKTGVLHGRQHHTLDRELFGSNAWLTGYYLCALRAMAKMAQYLNEPYQEYLDIFERGKKWVCDNLFNGEYFFQKIELNDLSQLDKYEACDRYYNYETGEVNFQMGDGCFIDQMVSGWHAGLLGLGYIYDEDKVKAALNSVYKYNFKKDLRNIFNPCRIFAYKDEAGVIMCEWGNRKPQNPVPYSKEIMTGFEYQLAVHMLMEGMEDKAIEIISAVRDRYDGKKRNPWNECECGSNYVRSMASYSALLAYSGFIFDMPNYTIGFKPLKDGDCKFFWSIDGAWGTFERKNNNITLTVLHGELTVKKFAVSGGGGRVTADGALVKVLSFDETEIVFCDRITIKNKIEITMD